MLIGELSKKSGLSRHTIRYYEEFGLIKVARKERRDNNYKEYPQEILERLLIINRLKELGFTLQEIKEIVEIFIQETNPCSDILVSVDKKLELIEQKMKELDDIKTRLVKIKASCNGNCKIDNILPSCVGC